MKNHSLEFVDEVEMVYELVGLLWRLLKLWRWLLNKMECMPKLAEKLRITYLLVRALCYIYELMRRVLEKVNGTPHHEDSLHWIELALEILGFTPKLIDLFCIVYLVGTMILELMKIASWTKEKCASRQRNNPVENV